MNYRRFLALTLGTWLGLCLSQVGAQPSSGAQTPGSDSSIKFEVRDGLKLDAVLRLPPSVEPKAIVVIMHGGGGIGTLEQQDVTLLLSQQPMTFDLILNVKVARSLGLAIPRSLLLRADQIIEQ